MRENILIPLPGFKLEKAFPHLVGCVQVINKMLVNLRVNGYFMPPRFFGYYFVGSELVVEVAGWTVTTDSSFHTKELLVRLNRITAGKYSVTSPKVGTFPDYLCIHDRQSELCHLWSFPEGCRLVDSHESVTGVQELPDLTSKPPPKR